jgi:hypothetical protein
MDNEIRNLLKNLDFTLEIRPEKWSGNKYIVHSKEFGLYSKKEAEAICAFLMMDAVRKFIYKVL